jgi:SNF2 family DNA or RNA helicase
MEDLERTARRANDQRTNAQGNQEDTCENGIFLSGIQQIKKEWNWPEETDPTRVAAAFLREVHKMEYINRIFVADKSVDKRTRKDARAVVIYMNSVYHKRETVIALKRYMEKYKITGISIGDVYPAKESERALALHRYAAARRADNISERTRIINIRGAAVLQETGENNRTYKDVQVEEETLQEYYHKKTTGGSGDNLTGARPKQYGQPGKNAKQDAHLPKSSKEYKDLMGEYYEWLENKKEESSSLTVQFSKIMKVRKVIANEKVKDTIEFVQNIIDQGKKVIIFTNFTDTLQLIHSHFGKESVYLDGSCNKVQRQYAVDQFQENEKIKVFVGNLKAAGVGLTLTAAEVVIMNDLSFVPAEHAQAEDRAYRYGQKNNVLVYYPIFENTIEGVIYDILNKKKKVIGTVMGDELQESGDVVEEILHLINKRS